MPQQVTIALQTEPNDTVRLLVGELETTLSAAYPPENRHGLPVEAIFQPHIRFFVAHVFVDGVGHDPAGCGGVALCNGFAELKRMYVREPWRGSGVAAALLRRLEREASDAGHTWLTLETGDAQHAALRFYRREGFAPCAAFGDYAAMRAPAIASSVFMHKRLANPAP